MQRIKEKRVQAQVRLRDDGDIHMYRDDGDIHDDGVYLGGGFTYLVEPSTSMNVHAIGAVEVETGGILRE